MEIDALVDGDATTNEDTLEDGLASDGDRDVVLEVNVRIPSGVIPKPSPTMIPPVRSRWQGD